MFNKFVLVRKGSIVKSGDYADLHNFAVQTFKDDKWAVMEYEEYNYFLNHPEERRSGGVMDNIAHNARTGNAKRFMRRPLKYYAERKR